MPAHRDPPFDGRCTCGQLRYRLNDTPLFVHCCHCRWCQRESGSAFAVNALIETDRLHTLEGRAESARVDSESGKGQDIVRCPDCRVAVWSHYAGLGDRVAFVRVGTLDEPEAVTPDIHIYTASKLGWVTLPDGLPASEAYYRASEHWPAASLERRSALRAG